MTSKQILDSFSETLIRDERILSAPERALIATLIHHAKAASGTSPELQDSVQRVIATSIGETVAQRAFGILGASIVERILENGSLGESAANVTSESLPGLAGPTARTAWMMPSPPSPSPGPQTPSTPPRPPSPGPQTPSIAMRDRSSGNESFAGTVGSGARTARMMPSPPSPAPGPQTPSSPRPMDAPLEVPRVPPAPGPQTPSVGIRDALRAHSQAATAVLPEKLPARCVVLDEFLAPQEVSELIQFAVDHENEFQTSEVISPTAEDGMVNYDYRRSRVLMRIGKYQDLLLDRIKSVLPEVLQKLGMEEFTIRDVEAQITASTDGDFFHFHSDNGNAPVASRYLTFVYFFHREPRAFEGGELRIHDARLESGEYVSEGSYQTVVPQQNQIVFFPCELMHEITTVKCPSQAFSDSRFTLNGWLRH